MPSGPKQKAQKSNHTRQCSGSSCGRTDKQERPRFSQNAYTLNNITAKAGADGSIAVQFGGCEGKVENYLPTPPGWNYLVRLYRRCDLDHCIEDSLVTLKLRHLFFALLLRE